MTLDKFNEALFYAVREDFNACRTSGYIDQKNDALIREAIGFIEAGNKFPETPYVAQVSIRALAMAARRRMEAAGNGC